MLQIKINDDLIVSGFSHIQEDVEYNADDEVMNLQRRFVSFLKQCNFFRAPQIRKTKTFRSGTT